MSRIARIPRPLPFLVLCLCILVLSGCHQRYGANRVYDFCDIVQVGVGVTFENPKTGIIPPSYGLHLQATEYLNLGAVHFSGCTAEWDGRGFFKGQESRTRLGLGPNQVIQIDQNYDEGKMNYFKNIDSSWIKRMNLMSMRWKEKPAKDLQYEFWADTKHVGMPLMHRGWQYWGNLGAEAGICDPFFTHMGLNLKLGLDISEFSDFFLGIFTVDFKNDDMTEDEFDEYTGGIPQGGAEAASSEPKPASDV